MQAFVSASESFTDILTWQALFRGVDRFSKLRTREVKCRFFPDPEPNKALLLHITTPKQSRVLSQFPLLYILNAIEVFANRFGDTGWVPSFNMRIDGFHEGAYVGYFTVSDALYESEPIDEGNVYGENMPIG